MQEKRPELRFSSRMTRTETVSALVYLPIHIWLLPLLLQHLPGQSFSGAELSFLAEATGVLYILVCQWRFLRRDFDALCDNLLFILLEIVICYGLMLAFNYLLGVLMLGLSSVLGVDAAEFLSNNPNNVTVMELYAQAPGMVAAAAVILAPLVEELIFRGGIFGLLRRRSRLLAYLGSITLFALVHVLPYALRDPLNWLYLLQYLPVTYLLCRCYERSNSIWGCIFLHMLINFFAIEGLRLLQEMT